MQQYSRNSFFEPGCGGGSNRETSFVSQQLQPSFVSMGGGGMLGRRGQRDSSNNRLRHDHSYVGGVVQQSNPPQSSNVQLPSSSYLHTQNHIGGVLSPSVVIDENRLFAFYSPTNRDQMFSPNLSSNLALFVSD